MNQVKRADMQSLQKEIHDLAVANGWWDAAAAMTPETIAVKLALIHSEVSEALEEVREGTPKLYFDENIGKPLGLASELADVVIRTLDLAGALEIPLEAVIRAKHEYNKTRPYRHGNKTL